MITLIVNRDALKEEKHAWLRTHLREFYFILGLSFLGFILSAFLSKPLVLLSLIPFAIITLFYSTPLMKRRKALFRLREIPGIKIFLISFVWSAVTILLPLVFSSGFYIKINMNLILMFVERFIFVFAITIPFDIRDMHADSLSGLKTIPLWLKERNSIQLANYCILLFACICLFHYYYLQMYFLIPAFLFAALMTLSFLNHKIWRSMSFYHYGILDGSLILQYLIVCSMHYLYYQSI